MADPEITVTWKKEPDEHDYPVAADHLELPAVCGIDYTAENIAIPVKIAPRLP